RPHRAVVLPHAVHALDDGGHGGEPVRRVAPQRGERDRVSRAARGLDAVGRRDGIPHRDGRPGAPGESGPDPRQHAGRVVRAGPAIAFELGSPGRARVELFDVLGRKRLTLADRGFDAGVHVLPWDGRDATGARAGRGLYFVRVWTPERTAVARLVLDR